MTSDREKNRVRGSASSSIPTRPRSISARREEHSPPDALLDAPAAAHPVVEGHDGGDGVPDAHGGEDDHLLDLAVQAVDRHRVLPHLRDAAQNQVQAVGHHRQQCLGDDGRQADLVDLLQNAALGLQEPGTLVHLPVQLAVEVKHHPGGDDLPEDRGPGGALYAHLRAAQPAVDHNGIHDDVHHRSGDLGDGGVQGTARGL